MKLYPEQALWDEIAYLAYHLHWDLDRLLDLEHADRARLIRSVADLNERAWEAIAQCPMTPSTASGSPRRRSSFEVDGVEIGRFMEISGLEVSVGVEDDRGGRREQLRAQAARAG